MKIGVISHSFRRSMKETLKIAHELGLDGVQMYAVNGEFCPEALSEEDIAEYKSLLKKYGLVASALCGDLGGHGFERADENPAKIEKTKRIIDLAVKFDTNVVTTHIGVIPADKTCEQYGIMLAALREIGAYAYAHGVTMAIETGPEPAPVLHDFVEACGKGIGVNLDPANFVMVTGQDPVEAVHLLAPYIVHTHLKDGIMLKKTDPRIIYNHFAEGGIEKLNVADYFKEVPIGKGQVDFPAYIAALREIGFDGFLTIERETGPDPVGDVALARDFAKKAIAD